MSEYRAKDYYSGDVASRYDSVRTADPSAARKWAREAAVLDSILSDFGRGESVLDLPVGNARFALLLRERGLQWVGADISADMLAAVPDHERDDAACIGLVRADAESAPFGADSFDHVVCMRFLNLVPLAVAGKVMAECARLARSTVVLEVRLARGRAVDQVLDAALRAASRARRRPRRAGTGGADSAGREPIVIHSESSFTDAVEAAGLEVLSRHAITPRWRPDTLWLLVAERTGR